MLNMEDFHVDTAKIPLSEVNYVYGVVGIWSSEGHHAHPTLLLLIPRLYGPLIALEGVQGESRCSCAARRAPIVSQILDIGSEICYSRSGFATYTCYLDSIFQVSNQVCRLLTHRALRISRI